MMSPVTLRAQSTQFARTLALAGVTLLTMSTTVSAQAPVAKAPAPAVGELLAVARAESPAGYMKRVGNELLAASRSGSAAQFAMVLNSNADIPSIGLSALGDYARSLPKNDRPVYYNGMINFIARYASKEALEVSGGALRRHRAVEERCSRHLRRQPRDAGRRQRLRRALAGRQARPAPTRCATRR